jgi:hypothetical protein
MQGRINPCSGWAVENPGLVVVTVQGVLNTLCILPRILASAVAAAESLEKAVVVNLGAVSLADMVGM